MSLISGIGTYALRVLSVLGGKDGNASTASPVTAGWSTIGAIATAVFSIRPEMLMDVATAAHAVGRFLEAVATSLGAK